MLGIGLIKSEKKLKRKIDMSNSLNCLLVFVFGLLSGLIYFGGLWLTIKKLSTSTIPSSTTHSMAPTKP